VAAFALAPCPSFGCALDLTVVTGISRAATVGLFFRSLFHIESKLSCPKMIFYKDAMRLVLPLSICLWTAAASQGPASMSQNSLGSSLPLVINTWSGPFTGATDAAFSILRTFDATALDAVVLGCSYCEANQCDGSVGFGGSPDEECETTLDALLIDGETLNVGAVAGLRRVKNAIGVARAVLEHTDHSLIVGDAATKFAVENGFGEEDLDSEESVALCKAWKQGGCQPNYRRGVIPDETQECGPYRPVPSEDLLPSFGGPASQAVLAARSENGGVPATSHDTISMIAISSDGKMAAGTSTNGLTHKIPGRVGDGPIAGSGSYVDSEVGGCGATGDGDVMMRFLPCYQAVESMRRGLTPQEAADDAVARMVKKYPHARTGVVVVDKGGQHAGAASGWNFSYSYRGSDMQRSKVVKVLPLQPGPR
jgi:N4-(beta-N-acetylglucosaminyl)-L-asparaginase